MANDEEHTPDFEDLLAAYDISDASVESSNLRNGNAMPTDHRGTPINLNFLKEMAFAETQNEACRRATPAPSGEDGEITFVENSVVEVRKKPVASDETCSIVQRSILDLGQAKQSKPKRARKNISTSCSRPLTAPIQKQVKTAIKARKTVKTLDPKPRANQIPNRTPNTFNCVSKNVIATHTSSSVGANGAEEDYEDVSDDDRTSESVTTQLYTNALRPYSPRNDSTKSDETWANAPTEGGFTCLECGDRFLLESSLANHLERRSVHITLNCDSCETKLDFYNRCALLSHVRAHRERNQTADLCETTFGPLSTDLALCANESQATGVALEKNQNSNAYFRCHECNLYCGSSLSLQEHFGCSRNRPSRTIRCGQCFMLFQSKCSLTSHRRIHFQEKPFVCPECGQSISESWDVFHLHLSTVCLHLSRTTGFKCTACETLTVTAVELRDHIVKCHSQSYYKCKECPMAFKSEVLFVAHRRSVHKTSDVQCLTICKCPLCDVVFQNGASLQAHLDSHVSELGKKLRFLFRCNVCKVLFEDKKILSGHLKQTHPSVFKVRCKICRSAFRDRDLLRDHKRRKHPELLCEDEAEDVTSLHVKQNETTKKVNVKRSELANEGGGEEIDEEEDKSEVCAAVSPNEPSKSTCQQCGRNFQSIQGLRIHQRSHTADDMRHRCAVCQEQHSDPESMARHGRTHLEAGQRVCTLCSNLVFATKFGLSRHLDHHASNSSYPVDCVFCGQSLMDATVAANHWKSEHLIYDFSCDKCDAQYLHKKSLTRHMKQMHPTIADRSKCYPCSICEDFAFSKKSLLVQHLESKHGISSVDIDLSQLIPKQRSASKSKKVAAATQHITKIPSPPSTASLPHPKRDSHRSSDGETLRRAKRFKAEEQEEENCDKEHFCAKCGHRAKTKSQFLDHIKVHKTERNLYQCLECGICFVVEPSLRKHLSFTHKIKDIDQFMQENGYSNGSVTGRGQQRNHNGMGPSTSSASDSATAMESDSPWNATLSDTVFECEVCYNTFETDLSLRTHMRTHGMAFIKIKRVSNVPVNEVHRSKPQTEPQLQSETNKSS